MDASLQNFVSRTGNEARKMLDEYGKLSEQNVLWAGTPNYQARITQQELDSVASFKGAGLTTQQLADACYALEQVRGILTNALPALTVLANLP